MDAQSLFFLLRAGPHESSSVLSFTIERSLGEVARATVDALFDAAIDPDEILGRAAQLQFGRSEAEHVQNGVVMGVTLVASPDDGDERRSRCRIHITSLMGLLAEEVDSRIFQDKDVREIVSEVLRGLDIGDERQSWRLVGTYPKREYCVQYQESALAFVSRLLEEEGIYYSSADSGDGELIVFEDESSSAEPIDGDKTLGYRLAAGLSGGLDAIEMLTERRRTRTGTVALRDYDFKRPQADLTATAAAADDADIEIYDYPGAYTDVDEGKRLAGVRLAALQAERAIVSLEGSCPRLVPGRWLEIVDAPNNLDGEYFITSVVHRLAAGVTKVTAELIPKSVNYRSPRRTPAPLIHGPQTAKIVAPEGAQPEEIHTDEHGRCKVRFHWDRYGRLDDSASCWIRVAQQQTSGSMILPRVGWEVIVEFLEGSPDRPIITGRVYNGRYMPPYALPEGKSRTALQTASSPGGGGRNEVRLEDSAGKEEIKIGAQKDTTLVTANNKTTQVAVDEKKNVKVDATLTVGANQTIKVSKGYKDTTGGSETAQVSGNRKVEVNAVYGLTSAGDSATSVGGSQMEMDGNPIQALLSLAVKAVTDAAKAEAAKAMQKLDQAVQSKVNQVMGPINGLQAQVQGLGAAMQSVSDGNLGAAASAFSAAGALPMPGAFGAALGGQGPGGVASRADSGAAARPERGAGATDGAAARGGGGGASSPPAGASAQTGLDSLVHGAIASAGAKLGDALGVGGGGGGGSSEANTAGPDGSVAGNSASDSATGPGHAINVCSSTHSESVGSVKVTIAAAGIHTNVTGARSQSVGAARVELVAGTRAETCSADKKEKSVGLVVLSKAPESEQVAGSRTTMVGGAVIEKIGASHAVAASGKAMFVGAFHKIDASGAIVFQCGESSVVIDGGGVAIKSPVVTVTASKVVLTGSVAEN